MQEQYLSKREEFSQALGKVVLKLREKSERSVRSVSNEIELSKTTLLLAEKGKLDPQISTFCRIAEAFYIKPEDLLKMVYKELPLGWSFLDENN